MGIDKDGIYEGAGDRKGRGRRVVDMNAPMVLYLKEDLQTSETIIRAFGSIKWLFG